MVFRPLAILVAPLITGVVQILDWRRIRMMGVELTYRIVKHLQASLYTQ